LGSGAVGEQHKQRRRLASGNTEPFLSSGPECHFLGLWAVGEEHKQRRGLVRGNTEPFLPSGSECRFLSSGAVGLPYQSVYARLAMLALDFS